MTPQSFESFRSRLDTASGFQSMQFRELEFRLGIKREAVLKYMPEGMVGRDAALARFHAPSLVDDLHAFLANEGFKVMAYTNDDLVTALRLEDAGCVAVMPLASPIGSGLGVVNPYFIREIKRRLEVPVIVDAGVGTASDACITMEQGVDGVLMNTALAAAKDPVQMAHAMKCATISGRLAFLAGRMTSHEIAVPSSAKVGMLD